MSLSDGCFWSVRGRGMAGEINGDDVKRLTITEAWLMIDGSYADNERMFRSVDHNCIL